MKAHTELQSLTGSKRSRLSFFNACDCQFSTPSGEADVAAVVEVIFGGAKPLSANIRVKRHRQAYSSSWTLRNPREAVGEWRKSGLSRHLAVPERPMQAAP